MVTTIQQTSKGLKLLGLLAVLAIIGGVTLVVAGAWALGALLIAGGILGKIIAGILVWWCHK